MDTDLISTKEACRVLDKDKATLGRRAKDGKINSAYRGEGKYRIMPFDRAAIEALK